MTYSHSEVHVEVPEFEPTQPDARDHPPEQYDPLTRALENTKLNRPAFFCSFLISINVSIAYLLLMICKAGE